MPEQNSGEKDDVLTELSRLSIERDRHIQAAENLREVRDELIEKAFLQRLPRKAIAAAAMLKEISLYKMMARRLEASRAEQDIEDTPDLFSHPDVDEPVEVVDGYGNVRTIQPVVFSEDK